MDEKKGTIYRDMVRAWKEAKEITKEDSIAHPNFDLLSQAIIAKALFKAYRSS